MGIKLYFGLMKFVKKFGKIFWFIVGIYWIVVVNIIDVVCEVFVKKVNDFVGWLWFYMVDFIFWGGKDIVFSDFIFIWNL